MEPLSIMDLISYKLRFKCQFSEYMCAYWDYEFSAENTFEQLYLDYLKEEELECLRENCKRILDVTNFTKKNAHEDPSYIAPAHYESFVHTNISPGDE